MDASLLAQRQLPWGASRQLFGNVHNHAMCCTPTRESILKRHLLYATRFAKYSTAHRHRNCRLITIQTSRQRTNNLFHVTQRIFRNNICTWTSSETAAGAGVITYRDEGVFTSEWGRDWESAFDWRFICRFRIRTQLCRVSGKQTGRMIVHRRRTQSRMMKYRWVVWTMRMQLQHTRPTLICQFSKLTGIITKQLIH